MTDSEIVYRKDGSLSALIGKDATHLMRVQVVISGIKMNIRTKGKLQLTRGTGIKKLLQIAGEYTKKKYTINQKEQAIRDLETFFHTLKAALPSRVEGDPP